MTSPSTGAASVIPPLPLPLPLLPAPLEPPLLVPLLLPPLPPPLLLEDPPPFEVVPPEQPPMNTSATTARAPIETRQENMGK